MSLGCYRSRLASSEKLIGCELNVARFSIIDTGGICNQPLYHARLLRLTTLLKATVKQSLFVLLRMLSVQVFLSIETTIDVFIRISIAN